MQIQLDPNSVDSYRTFLAVKKLPRYSIRGRVAEFPDEYADRLGLVPSFPKVADYLPAGYLFDYQRDITALAIRKQKFAMFADCGLGKTAMLLEFARHARNVLPENRPVLIVSPLMVIDQTIAESERFYGGMLPVRQVRSKELSGWMVNGRGIGITNYDALDDDTPQGNIGALILDESSMLKSHYGKWGTKCIDLGKGLDWKLALTGTPAPNDRIEYANHAVFLDQFPTVNAFLARYFVNRGQTQERWEIRPHAIGPFYTALSHWSIFISNPATYGWKDNTAELPPIHVHIHDVDMTDEQNRLVGQQTGTLFATDIGGIVNRSSLGGIAKGHHKGVNVDTRKPAYIRELVESWPNESTIIWCLYNAEQDKIAAEFPDAANITGSTPHAVRLELIDQFKRGERRVMISKPKILGFGLNLQICTRQVFSGLQDSYEQFYQAVKRSNRYGSKLPLNVHIPVTDIERPMIDTVLRKAKRVQQDTEEQEKLFRSGRDTQR